MLEGGEALSILAVSCAERMGVLAQRVAEGDLIGPAVRHGLELSWRALSAGVDDSAISQAIADLKVALDSANGDLGKYHGYVDDAVSAVIYALMVVRDGDRTLMVNVLTRCRDVAFELAQELWPGLSLAAQVSSPPMNNEVLRQVRDATVVSEWANQVGEDRLAVLRDEARREGHVLAKLITGADTSSPKGSSQDDQLPLF